MKSEDVISIVRTVCGTAIFIIHMMTGYNGSAMVLSLVLLGVPVEKITHAKKD